MTNEWYMESVGQSWGAVPKWPQKPPQPGATGAMPDE